MRDYPAIKITIYFIAGLIIQNIFHLQFLLLAGISFGVSAVFILFRLFKVSNYIITLFPMLLIALSAMFYLAIFQHGEISYPFTKSKIKDAVVNGEIKKIDLIGEKSLKIVVSTDSISGIENEKLNRGISVLCSIWDDTTRYLQKLYSVLEVGNHIRIKGNIQKAREKRNPGEFDYYKYLLSENISAIINVYDSQNISVIDNETSVISNTVHSIRKAIDRQINKMHTKHTAALIRGLLLADRSQIDYDIKEKFVNAGVIHVLAVSGLHVSYIVLIFFLLFNRFNIKLKWGLTIAGIVFFFIITTGPASVFRASVMAIVLILSFLTNRSYNSINAISIAALIILLLNPYELFNPGFQLSFSVVIAIILLYPKIKNLIYSLNITSGILRNIFLFLGVSLSAQIGTLPFTLIYFNKLSIAAIFANIIVIPLIGAIIANSIITVILGSIWGWFGLIFGSSSNIMSDFLFLFVKSIGGLEYSFLRINQFSLFDGIVFYAALLLILYFFKKNWRVKSKLTVTIILFFIAAVLFKLDDYNILQNNKLSIFTIDVGQGDAALINFPNGMTALIDAGNCTQYFDNGSRVIKPFLEKFGIDRVDLGIVSHIDSDHYGGFISLIKEGIIRKIIKPAPDTSSQKDITFEKMLKDLNIPFEYYSKRRIQISNCNLYLLNDTLDMSNLNFDSNNRSGVVKIVYGRTSFLFVGDLGIEGEEQVLQDFGGFVKADYLKIGHHGSKTSSSATFIDAVKPKIGIISAGAFNNFNHPSPLILQRLAERNIHIERTDYDGGILYVSDGKKIEKVGWKNFENNILQN